MSDEQTEALAAGGPGGPTSGTPRVVLVDDHDMFRTGVRTELGDDVEVVRPPTSTPRSP